jgi:short-subunit dehydrogenase
MDRALILGASRGLGAELVRAACGATYPVIGFGRKEAPLKALRENFPLFDYVSADFSTESGQNTVLAHIKDVPFSKLIYVAGGGPYGDFGSKKWAAHEWAWEVVLVGSSVAEASADKSAASYAAAKHALKGLWSSLRLDYPDWDLRLFSPGYMNTELLPANAPVREKGVYSPRDVAEELWTWSLSADNGGHRVYPKHPV